MCAYITSQESFVNTLIRIIVVSRQITQLHFDGVILAKRRCYNNK